MLKKPYVFFFLILSVTKNVLLLRRYQLFLFSLKTRFRTSPGRYFRSSEIQLSPPKRSSVRRGFSVATAEELPRYFFAVYWLDKMRIRRVLPHDVFRTIVEPLNSYRRFIKIFFFFEAFYENKFSPYSVYKSKNNTLRSSEFPKREVFQTSNSTEFRHRL